MARGLSIRRGQNLDGKTKNPPSCALRGRKGALQVKEFFEHCLGVQNILALAVAAQLAFDDEEAVVTQRLQPRGDALFGAFGYSPSSGQMPGFRGTFLFLAVQAGNGREKAAGSSEKRVSGEPAAFLMKCAAYSNG